MFYLKQSSLAFESCQPEPPGIEFDVAGPALK